jgi:hypothetical protein
VTATQTGAQIQLNLLTKAVIPVVQASAPVWEPGLYWIDTSAANAIMEWNGSSWVSVASAPYLALLTANPAGVTTVAGLTEDTTAGYARVACPFSLASAGPPVTISNSSLVTFGPYSANQALSVNWAALVTTSSGTGGFLLEIWTIQPQQVLQTATINIAASSLQIALS